MWPAGHSCRAAVERVEHEPKGEVSGRSPGRGVAAGGLRIGRPGDGAHAEGHGHGHTLRGGYLGIADLDPSGSISAAVPTLTEAAPTSEPGDWLVLASSFTVEARWAPDSQHVAVWRISEGLKDSPPDEWQIFTARADESAR